MTSLVVGVTGRKRAGKDTFARRLVETHGFTRIGFADALKTVMEELNPVVPIELDENSLIFGPGLPELRTHHMRLAHLVQTIGWEQAKELREVRRLLQAHGVAIREHTDPDVWVDAVRRKVYAIEGPVVISDVRFPNEAGWVQHEAAGQLVRVHRDDHDTSDTHISETALDDWPVDAVIGNVGTLADLHAQADQFAALWRE